MKRVLCLSLCLTLALTACGGTTAQSPTPSAEAPTVTETPAATPTPVSIPKGVENNGRDYVRVDDRIYFRKYGPQAVSATTLFGIFTADYNTTGMESELVAYDLITGAVEPIFTDTGFGPLWYGNGGFYLQERINSEDQVAWYSLDGAETRELSPGRLLAVTDSGLVAVAAPDEVERDRTVYTLFRDGELLWELSPDGDWRFAGLTDAGLFLVKIDRDVTPMEVSLWQAPIEVSDGEFWRLGVLPGLDDDYPYYAVEIDDFLSTEKEVAVVIGYYAGTAYMLNNAQAVKAQPGYTDSLVELDLSGLEEFVGGEPPQLTTDATGQITLTEFLAGDLRLNYGYPDPAKDGDLELYDGTAWITLVRDFQPPQTGGLGFRRIPQAMVYINGRAYVTAADSYVSPVDNIGWREAYTILEMDYLEITPGAEKTLATVVYDNTLMGNLWRTADGKGLLWQQTGGEFDQYPDALAAYRIPLGSGCTWIGANKDSLPTVELSGQDGEFGYGIPETAGVLGWLRLNGKGEAVEVSDRSPDALLSIQFDVNEKDLAGAAEKIDPGRRDSDEDLPRSWAKLTALQDGVRVVVERTADQTTDLEDVVMTENQFIPGETLLDLTLDRGQYAAVRASLPHHPETRVWVSRGEGWGSYVFGEDNHLRPETETGSHPEITLAGYPTAHEELIAYTGARLRADLEGTWLYRDSVGQTLAALRFSFEEPIHGAYTMSLQDGDWNVYYFTAMPDRLFAGEYDAPDLLALTTDQDEVKAKLGFNGSVGDYLVDLYRTDGVELLRLTQVNNGDGALSRLLPGAKDTDSGFTFIRFEGTGKPGPRRRNTTFPAQVVRYDRPTYSLWLQEMEVADTQEDGSPLYRPIAHAPCMAYPIANKDAILPLRACDDPGYPMTQFDVTVDNEGKITFLGW